MSTSKIKLILANGKEEEFDTATERVLVLGGAIGTRCEWAHPHLVMLGKYVILDETTHNIVRCNAPPPAVVELPNINASALRGAVYVG